MVSDSVQSGRVVRTRSRDDRKGNTNERWIEKRSVHERDILQGKRKDGVNVGAMGADRRCDEDRGSTTWMAQKDTGGGGVEWGGEDEARDGGAGWKGEGEGGDETGDGGAELEGDGETQDGNAEWKLRKDAEGASAERSPTIQVPAESKGR